jgi:outer membrane protein assembly factor BamB
MAGKRSVHALTSSLAATALLSAAASHAWQVNLGRARYANDVFVVAIDSEGDVLAAGTTEEASPGPGRFTVAKVSRANGAVLWRQDLSSVGGAFASGEALAVAVDAADDVVAAGALGSRPAVVKLSGATGAVLWHYRMATDGAARAVVLDPAGDVAVVGHRAESFFFQLSRVGVAAKLSGATGSEIWRRTIVGTTVPTQAEPIYNDAHAAAIDPSGDVLIAAETENVGTGQRFTTLKLAGGNGAEIWRDVPVSGCNQGSRAQAVAASGAGDAVVAGLGCSADTLSLLVRRLAGGSGALVWEQRLDDESISLFNPYGGAHAVVLDGGGDAFVAGHLGGSGIVLRLGAATGAELWRTLVDDHRRDPFGVLYGLGLSPTGDVLATGATTALAVVALDRATGAERWRRLLGPAVPGRALASDDQGDVAVAGVSIGGADPLFTVAKLRGDDGGGFAGIPCGSVVCGPCEVCVAPGTCTVGPATGCREPGLSGLELSQASGGDEGGRVAWKWARGAGFPASAFGDPRQTTGYELCVFDGVGSSPSLVLNASATAAAFCNLKPCWKAMRNGFGYKDSAGARALTRMKLGGAGTSNQVAAKGRGVRFALPPLGLALPVTVELRTSTGECWGTTFDQARDNSPYRFEAKRER